MRSINPHSRTCLRGLGGVLMLSAVLMIPVAAFSAPRTQEVTGNIQGEVRDQTGALVPNVTVTAVSERRTFTAMTSAEGIYRLNDIPPGVYTITAVLKGFTTARADNVIVELGKTLSVVL